MVYSINWPNSIAWLSLLRKMLRNMCILIICFPFCDVINFEINLNFLSKTFFCMTKMPGQKFKYGENTNTKSFKMK